MGTVAETTALGQAIWYDADETQRWLDARGPTVNKVIEEFVNVAFASTSNMAAYTTTLVNSSTVATVAGNLGGAIIITTDGANNDGANIQALGEAFLPLATNQIYFGIKLSVSEATQSDFLVGLAITTTDALGGVTDGIYFRKVDGSTTCNHVIETASTETETTALTVAADTAYVLEWTWDGSAIEFYVNGTAGTTPAITNIPTAEYMSPVIHYLTGENVSHTMTVHWMRCIQVAR